MKPCTSERSACNAHPIATSSSVHLRIPVLSVTFDLDFGDLRALGVLSKPSAILFRLADERPESVNQRLAVVIAECLTDLEAGALVLVEDTRYRVRKLPIGRST